jgi:hypothetical protein
MDEQGWRTFCHFMVWNEDALWVQIAAEQSAQKVKTKDTPVDPHWSTPDESRSTSDEDFDEEQRTEPVEFEVDR